MATQALIFPRCASENDTTRSDGSDQRDNGEEWRLVSKNSHRSYGSSVCCPTGGPSQKHSTTGQFQLCSSASLSAKLTDATTLAAEMEKSLKHVGDSSSLHSSLAPSTSRKAATLPEEKEKSATRLKSRSMGFSVPWQRSRIARGTKTRKVIHLTIRRPSDRNKQKTVTKANCLHGQDFSSEGTSMEEIDNMSQGNTHDFCFIPAYQSKGEVFLHTSLSQKYQPKLFKDIAGHEIIVKAISSAVEKKKIAPLYLFHGPSGTGKTSTARIFAVALNCESTSHTKPCWSCRGCSRSLYIMELCSGSRIAGLERIKTLIHSTSFTQATPGFKVLIIEECHLFTAEAWDELLSIVEGTCDSTLVFVLVTIDANKVPRNVTSRCQKFGFPKLKDKDITLKLAKIVARENIGIEREALKLIIVKSEGSLREAENILDQLALLGSTISSSMVQQLVGLVPQSKLIDLLATAVSGDTVKTVKCTKDLITGIEPLALVSQLASLIVDILSGATVADSSSSVMSSKDKRLLRSRSQLTNPQSARLCYALKILVETEKQLRCSTDQTSGILAALLEISSEDVCNRVPTGIIMPQNITVPLGDEPNAESGDIHWHSSLDRHSIRKTSRLLEMNMIEPSMHKTQRCSSKEVEEKSNLTHMSDMETLWKDVLEKIQSRHIKEFLCHQVTLASLSVSRVNAIVHLMFKRAEDKMVAQMSEESISKALKIAIGCPVTVNMSLEPVALGIVEENTIYTKSQPVDFKQQQRAPYFPEFVHSMNIAHLITARDSSPLSGDSRPTKLKDCSPTQGQDRCRSKGKDTITDQPQQISHTRGNQFDKSADPERGISTRERTSIDITRTIRADKPKHRWLSLSSIPQSDASVEPYSQDILFENANRDGESKARKNPKFQKGISKGSKDQHSQDSAIHAQLNCSWSCIDKLCPKKTEV